MAPGDWLDKIADSLDHVQPAARLANIVASKRKVSTT